MIEYSYNILLAGWTFFTIEKMLNAALFVYYVVAGQFHHFAAIL